MDFNLDTSEKIISLIAGILAIGGIIFWRKNKDPVEGNTSNTNSVNQNVSINVGEVVDPKKGIDDSGELSKIARLKRETNILFIDDERDFKVVRVLKKMEWENTKLVADISSLEQKALVAADVVFVDIQGVGHAMQYNDEGLGLALAIKKRYPQKKVIIYSAEENGARFHDAFVEADYQLPKISEPIRFEETILKLLSK